VKHKGKTARFSVDEIIFIAALVRVMPAMLINNDLARKVWDNSTDAANRLDDLIRVLKPALAEIGLRINTVQKLGRSLATI
jgi:DNA-binding winged helix-turn-helix (wHTH) protein